MTATQHPRPARHTTAHPEGHPRRWAGLAVLSASLLLVVMDMTILNVALPAISADLQPDSVQQLWIVDAYPLTLAGLLVLVSAAGDRFGRRLLLLAGFVVFGLGALLVLIAESPGAVIAIRVLLGVGGAMIMPSTLSLIRSLFTDGRERAFALGIWGATAALGGALGPVVGGVLLEHFSWHAAFLVNVPVMVVAIVAGLILLPEVRSARPPRIDAASTLLSVVGMVGLVYAIKQVGKDGPTLEVIAVAAVAAVVLTVFVRRCLAMEQPMLEVRLFASRTFTGGVLSALASGLSLTAMLFVGAQWLQLVRGWSPLEAGLALLPMAVGGLIGSPFAPALARRIGARTVLAGGLVATALGYLALFAAPTVTYPWLAAALALAGIGMAAMAVASAVIMMGAPADKAGSAAAMDETSWEVGGVLGVSVLGSLVAALYRAGLPDGELGAHGIGPAAADAARESLGGAMAIAERSADGAWLAAQAGSAYSEALGWFGLAGGVLMLAIATAVWWLTPADLDLDAAEH